MYNAELYIGNCLDSILHSDLPQDAYEIFIVNDGSKDGCPQIAQEYASRYANITYLTQENQGQSTARNNGIQQCNGEFVWFVDADDRIAAHTGNFIEQLAPDLDILGVQLKEVSEDMKFLQNSCTQPTVKHNVELSGREAIIAMYNPSSVCALITRRTFLLEHQLFFVPGITHQDVELSYRMMAVAKKVIFTDLVPYVYIQHPASVSHNPQKKIKYKKDEVYIIKSFRRLAVSCGSTDVELSEAIFNRSQNVLWGLVYEMFSKRGVWAKNGINEAVLTLLKHEKLYPVHGPLDSLKKRLFLCLLNRESFLH